MVVHKVDLMWLLRYYIFALKCSFFFSFFFYMSIIQDFALCVAIQFVEIFHIYFRILYLF